MRRLAIFAALIALIGLQVQADPSGINTVSSHRPAGETEGGLQPVQLLSTVQAATSRLLNIYSPQELERGVYVGSQFCLACHPNRGAWEDTLHARFLRRPLVQNSLIPRKGVIADFDGNGVDDFIQGLDFNAINSAFDTFKPNAPKLSVEGGVYYVTVGQLKCPVTFTQAGQAVDNAQRYVVRIPVADSPTGFSDSNYFAPLQYSGGAWVPNSPSNWYSGNTPRWGPATTLSDLADHGGNYARTCVGCHSTGIRRVGQNPSGEYSFDGFVAVLFDADDETVFDWDLDGNFDLMNIGCESCHGPGSAHILGGGDPDKMINPEELPVSAQVDICGRCHTRPKSVPNGIWDWPFNDATNTNYTPVEAAAGIPLSDFMDTSQLPLWPDGKHMRTGRPYHDYVNSPKPTFRFGGVSCTDCHSPHREAQPHMIRTSITEDGLRIPTEVENNTLCLACHAGFGPFRGLSKEQIAEIEEEANHDAVAKVVSVHANHPYAPERRFGLARCVECHMPATFGFGSLTGRSHTFEAISPEKTLEFQAEGGMPNSCAQSCHGFKVDVFDIGIDPNPNNSVWNEPFDRELARELEDYFGPGGLWWDTEDEP